MANLTPGPWAIPDDPRITGHRPDPIDPSECLEYGEDCSGPVGFHSTGPALSTFPRCDFHQDRRQERYESSIERESESDSPPSWFDPTYAGERWESDY